LRTCNNCGQNLRDDDRFCSSCGQPARHGLLADDRVRKASSNVAGYVGAARRFWWVLVIGVFVATLAALSSRYSISAFPPGLEEKTEVTYSATSRLLVSSSQNPHARSQVSFLERPEEGASGTDGETGDGGGEQAEPIIVSQPPDINTLVRSANLYPLLIESDQVAEYRHEKFGTLPGSVTAQGIYAFSTQNRFELSEIPVIQLVATSSTPRGAVDLADKTAEAFVGWLAADQEESGIPERDRIEVEQINAPTAATASAGPSTTLPLLVFVVVLGAFCVLTVLLDRIIAPRAPRARAETEPEPVKVKKTA
jgi:hypothetical protein